MEQIYKKCFVFFLNFNSNKDGQIDIYLSTKCKAVKQVFLENALRCMYSLALTSEFFNTKFCLIQTWFFFFLKSWHDCGNSPLLPPTSLVFLPACDWQRHLQFDRGSTLRLRLASLGRHWHPVGSAVISTKNTITNWYRCAALNS